MRKITIHDDLTGQPVAEADLQTEEFLFAGITGTFEGTAGSVKALVALFSDQDSTRLRELLAATPAKAEPKKAAKAGSKPRAAGDHSARDAREWCATEDGQAAVSRLGATVPAHGQMPKTLIEAWQQWQESRRLSANGLTGKRLCRN